MDDYEHVTVLDRAELRAWLEANAARTEGIWLVTYRRGSGRTAPTYDEIVEEALCFGWIDSTVRGVDDERSKLLFTPRKPVSTWSAVNKRRLESLLASGLMAERGLRAIETAKANGSWELLDAVERLEVPADLAQALAAAGARATWDGFPRGARKQMLWQVISAKRAPTRLARIERIVSQAQTGERAWG